MVKLKEELERAFPSRVVLLYGGVIVIKYMTGSPSEYEVARMKIDKTGVIYNDNAGQRDEDKANRIVAKHFNIEGESEFRVAELCDACLPKVVKEVWPHLSEEEHNQVIKDVKGE